MATGRALKVREAESLRRQLAAWIGDRVRETGARGVVFGLSGGLDSAVVCGLSAEALGPDRCLGLIMPIESIELDARLAREVAARFRVPTIELNLGGAFRKLEATLSSNRERVERMAGGGADASELTAPIVSESAAAMARANLKPRLRMCSLYYHANLLGYLVLGTGNRDEFTVGYFTKWGDGGADAFPLADLVKSEVREVARALGVPAEVIERPPSAGLWEGHTDEEEMGITYDQLDRYLLTGSSGDSAVDERIRRREELARHKLEPSPVARPR